MKLLELHVNSIDLNKFEADCQPWLDAIRGSRQPAWHGDKSTVEDWEIRNMKRFREPKNTPVDLHNNVNDFFSSRFGGWRAREQSIFVSGDIGTAWTYGLLYAIFPIGDFQSLWSPDIQDLTNLYDEFKGEQRHVFHRRGEEADMLARAQTLSFAKSAKWYFNDKIKEGLADGNEMLIRCDSFYMLNNSQTYHDTVRPHLINRGYLEAS